MSRYAYGCNGANNAIGETIAFSLDLQKKYTSAIANLAKIQAWGDHRCQA